MGLFLSPLSVLSQSGVQEKTCIDCHKRTVKKDILHGPVGADCTNCHKPNGQKHPLENVSGFSLIANGAKLCYTCHKSFQSTIKTYKRVHPPVAKGECLECHEVHSSNDSNLIFTKPPDLCYFCHSKIEKKVNKSKIVHLPVKEEGGCIICHSPHASNQKKLLVSKNRTLCLSCHNKVIMKGDREITNIDKLLKESKVQHPALKKRCTACHRPHASNNKFLLKYPFPTGNYAKGTEETYELCLQCHDPDLLLAERTTTATEFRDGDRNLHFVHVNKEKGRACLNCHNVHGSKRDHLIPETVKFGSWDMPLKYIGRKNGGSCSGCHKVRSYTR